MKPIAFKVRGGGNYSGTKGGTVRPNEKGGTGALWYVDKTFTIASTQDQFIAAPITSERTINQPMTQPNNTPQVPMRFLSVCSGMEAASVAWEPLGWKAVGFSEIEPFPCAILKHRFPNTPNYGSLTEYQNWPLDRGSIDLLVGGTPCQSFSVAGLRKGLDDPRGNLALVFLGLADKLKPRWIVWENVPGVLSSGGGRDFGSFLGALVELGYGFAYRVLDAQHFGVPQRRRRVFVVACLGDWHAPAKVLLEPDCVRRNPAKGRKKGQGVAPGVEGGVDADGIQRTVGTLCADTHPEAYSGQDAYTGRLIPQEKPVVIGRHAFNQGQNAQYEPHIAESEVMDSLVARGPHAVGQPIAMRESGQGYWMEDDKAGTLRAEGENRPSRPSHVIGQPIPYRKSKRAQSVTDDESWVEAEASNTLNNFGLGDTRTTHAVVEPIPLDLRNAGRDPEKKDEMNRQGLGVGQPGEPAHTITTAFVNGVAHEQKVYENHPNDSRVTGPLEVAPTVVSRFGTGGGNVPFVSNEPVAFQPGNLRRKGGADPSTEVFPTLTKDSGDQSPHVAFCADKAGTLTVGHHSCAGHQHRMGDNSFLIAPVVPMAVRRLTPVECERLQGFPDNWSRIPWKNKPAEECPDGPRYKACGNSMAVPVMRWIGERIAQVELSHNTQPTTPHA